MIPGPKELACWPGPKGTDKRREKSMFRYRLAILEADPKKAARRSVPRKTATNRVHPKKTSYFPCFAYQSALIGVKLFHFSGRSSRAKIAVTGQTGTQAPQSMHSVGWMYSCVSASKAGSSLRGWMQSTGQTSTHAVSFVPMHGSAIT